MTAMVQLQSIKLHNINKIKGTNYAVVAKAAAKPRNAKKETHYTH